MFADSLYINKVFVDNIVMVFYRKKTEIKDAKWIKTTSLLNNQNSRQTTAESFESLQCFCLKDLSLLKNVYIFNFNVKLIYMPSNLHDRKKSYLTMHNGKLFNV